MAVRDNRPAGRGWIAPIATRRKLVVVDGEAAGLGADSDAAEEGRRKLSWRVHQKRVANKEEEIVFDLLLDLRRPVQAGRGGRAARLALADDRARRAKSNRASIARSVQDDITIGCIQVGETVESQAADWSIVDILRPSDPSPAHGERQAIERCGNGDQITHDPHLVIGNIDIPNRPLTREVLERKLQRHLDAIVKDCDLRKRRRTNASDNRRDSARHKTNCKHGTPRMVATEVR